MIHNGTLPNGKLQNSMFQNGTLHYAMLQNGTLPSRTTLQNGLWFQTVHTLDGTVTKRYMLHNGTLFPKGT